MSRTVVGRPATPWVRLLLVVTVLAASLTLAGPGAADAATRSPSGLRVRASSTTSLTMTWTAVAKAPSYRLQYATSSSMAKARYRTSRSTTSTLEGLRSGTTYYVKVRVVSRTGANLSSYSKAVKVTTAAQAPAAPATPTPTPTPTPEPTPTSEPEREPTEEPSPSPEPEPTPTPETAPAPEPAAAGPVRVPGRLNLPAQPAVLLLGDSYTEGVGAVPLSNGYAYKIAEPLGWTLTRDGRGGSGYVNPTRYGAGVFADRLVRQPADAFDLVVLQGSSNDITYASEQIDANVAAALQVVGTRFPRAQVLMVGPTSPYGNPSADLLRVNDLVRAAATSRGIAFVDPIAERWFVRGDGTWAANPANGHPSNDGYQRIADRLVADVKVLGCGGRPGEPPGTCTVEPARP